MALLLLSILLIIGAVCSLLRAQPKQKRPEFPKYIKFCKRSGAIYADTSHPDWQKMMLEKCNEISRLR